MLFTLEALQAEKGDSLILHFGDPQKPRFIVIDGGPDPVFTDTLEPRLQQLRTRWANGNGKLPIDMVMVSHIDDDHINGILSWFRGLRELNDNSEALPDSVQTLWFNSFDEVLGNGAEELRSRLSQQAAAAMKGGAAAAEFNPDPGQGHHTAAIIASVGQGRELRAVSTALGIPLNKPFSGLVMPKSTGDQAVTLAGGLTLHVLGPTAAQVAALQKSWDEDVKKRPHLGAEAAAFSDGSVANLSSIVALAEFPMGKKTGRMLLTGDARGDFIWDGLIQAGFLKDREDTLHLDLIKMPHHGSNRNMNQKFLEHITADHYVISANGENDNPDSEIFDWLAKARGKARYTVHLTNQKLVNPKQADPKKRDISALVNAALAASAGTATQRTVEFRKRDALSLKVDLGTTAVNY